jgi:hypothetical protein
MRFQGSCRNISFLRNDAYSGLCTVGSSQGVSEKSQSSKGKEARNVLPTRSVNRMIPRPQISIGGASYGWPRLSFRIVSFVFFE